MKDASCNLFKPLLLSLDALSQSIIFRPLAIKVFNLCIQVNSHFYLDHCDTYVFEQFDVFQNVHSECGII